MTSVNMNWWASSSVWYMLDGWKSLLASTTLLEASYGDKLE